MGLIAVVVLVTGCMPKLTIEDIRACIPEKPAELEQLNVFVGEWDFTGEMTITGLDQKLSYTGEGKADWEGDGWYLVSRGSGRMEELGDSHGMEAWTYDANGKQFRTAAISNSGSVGTGIAWYDGASKTWHVKESSEGAFGKMTWKGTIKVIDDDHMDFHWQGYSGWNKTMEMTGKRTRK
jgi:hypothetical protein